MQNYSINLSIEMEFQVFMILHMKTEKSTMLLIHVNISLESVNIFLVTNTYQLNGVEIKLYNIFIIILRQILLLPGLQSKVEARNVNYPCKTIKDYGDQAKCQCKMNLCFCHPANKKCSPLLMVLQNKKKLH
jgi:hypothetical protein